MTNNRSSKVKTRTRKTRVLSTRQPSRFNELTACHAPQFFFELNREVDESHSSIVTVVV